MEVATKSAPRNRVYLYESATLIRYEFTLTKRDGRSAITTGTKKFKFYKNDNPKAKKKGVFYITFDEERTYKITRGKTEVCNLCATILFKESDRLNGVDYSLELNFPSTPTRFHEVFRIHFLEKNTNSTTGAVSKKQPVNKSLQVYDAYQANFPRATEVLASDLCRSAESFASNLVSKAEAMAESLHTNADAIKEHRQNYGSTGEEVEVDSGLKTAVDVASVVTGVAATVATNTVYGIGYALSAFGSTFGPAIKAGASSLIAKQFEKDERLVRHRVDNFCDIAGGLLSAAGTVLAGVEQSVRVVGPSVGRNISESMALKHGEQVGEVTGRVLETAGNVAEIGYNVKMLRPQLALKSIPDPKLDKDCEYEHYRRNFYDNQY